MGMEFRPYYLAKEWNKSGNDVLVVAANHSHLRKTNPTSLGTTDVEGVPYFWIWTNKYDSNGIARFINIFLFVLQLIVLAPYFIIKHKPDVVIASSTYLLDIFPAFLISFFTRAKLVFEIHDVWPMTLIEIGSMHPYHPFILLLRFAEWFTYSVCDKVVSILPNAYEHAAKFGIEAQNFKAISNGYYFDSTHKSELLPATLKETTRAAKKQYKRVVGYAGGLAKSNAMGIIIELFKEIDDVALIIVGSGTEEEALKAMAKSAKNIYWHKPITKMQVATFLKDMDFLIFSVKDSPLYKHGISFNKIFDYMHAAKPIIQIANLEDTDISKANCGFEVKIREDDAMLQEVKEILLNDKRTLEKLGSNGLDFLKKHKSYKVLASEFLTFL